MTRWITVAAAALILTGCEIMPPSSTPTERIEVIERETPPAERAPDETPTPRDTGREPRTVAFPVGQYAALEKTGSAVISGQLTLGGQPIAGAGISAAPVTTYSAEAAEKALAGIAVEAADPRASEYTHRTRTDGNGRFRLSGLPSGEFYVSGSGRNPSSGRPQVVIKQVTLGNGQQLNVELSR
ncbi:carboxypeptidase-like regulatory domain-containing protein [Halomonas urumqiensis]|uniref:Carboxypeptidase regulatory-like domain-containing protein n=1 Tax=Halomonas urumqiensis TaxID=1684789 RepID=A0A2N7UFU6_9GAMM|nr:carboxypeptidase-like regulatory domain-containing protein [Halomonas urumqiensis]PMR79304.1 hypothetical protein C1H70_13550 [Halomonas urumqiensis]PTB03978.1 carboxypeptidase regulatory-like domain-containing protein [Halomonas urumqiensis]GHE19765.1 hypothetical protein GCM10017767_02860 [Halomonas urumqiensis]